MIAFLIRYILFCALDSRPIRIHYGRINNILNIPVNEEKGDKNIKAVKILLKQSKKIFESETQVKRY